jgi:hypothetical protein
MRKGRMVLGESNVTRVAKRPLPQMEIGMQNGSASGGEIGE